MKLASKQKSRQQNFRLRKIGKSGDGIQFWSSWKVTWLHKAD